jgi:hypothetical protein
LIVRCHVDRESEKADGVDSESVVGSRILEQHRGGVADLDLS